MRSLSLLVLAAWLCLAGAVYADDSSGAQNPPADEQPAAAPVPAGPTLQSSDNSPTICDPGKGGFRFVEVRGTGFDAWATQRLVGNVIDGRGVPQMQWGSVWVSPQGKLTLEVNLCADPFRNRPALPAGDYTVSVGPGSGGAIAATSISLAPPAAPVATDDTTALDEDGNPIVVAVPPTPGSRQKPFPLGAAGTLVDGWQFAITSIAPDAWADIHSTIASSIQPPPDQRDFMVGIQATYVGPGTAVFSANRLALVSGTQATYDQLHNGCGIVPTMIPSNVVTSGTVVLGNVCFTVRAADADALVLVDNQSADTDRLYFALK